VRAAAGCVSAAGAKHPAAARAVELWTQLLTLLQLPAVGASCMCIPLANQAPPRLVMTRWLQHSVQGWLQEAAEAGVGALGSACVGAGACLGSVQGWARAEAPPQAVAGRRGQS
jgi:hypothetical protein